MTTLVLDPSHAHPVADLIRVIFGLIPATTVIGLTVAVVLAYFRAWRITRYKRVHRGLLPYHVWMIGVSYLTILGDSIYGIYERLHHPLTPHTLILFPGYVLGCIALWKVLKYERLRYDTESIITEDLGPTDGK